MNREKISACVIAFNEERNVPRIYEAVRAALAGERFEMIFVDDGSSDHTAERIRQLGAESVVLTLGSRGAVGASVDGLMEALPPRHHSFIPLNNAALDKGAALVC